MLSIEYVNNQINMSIDLFILIECKVEECFLSKNVLKKLAKLKLTLPDVATICCGSVFPEKLPNNGD